MFLGQLCEACVVYMLLTEHAYYNYSILLIRDICVLLCGWPSLDVEGDLEAFLKR